MKRQHCIIELTSLLAQPSFAFITKSYSSHHLAKTVTAPSFKKVGVAAMYTKVNNNLQIILCVLQTKKIITSSDEVNVLVALKSLPTNNYQHFYNSHVICPVKFTRAVNTGIVKF